MRGHRAAQPEDLDALVELEERLFERPWGREQLFALIARADVQLEVAPSSGEVVAYCVLRRVGPEAELDRIGVAPEERRRGWGSDLLRAVMERAWARGVERVHLEVGAENRAARAMYEALGFAIVGRRRGYYPASSGGAREDAVLMSAEPSA